MTVTGITHSYGIHLYHWVVLRVLVDHGVYPPGVPGWALLRRRCLRAG